MTAIDMNRGSAGVADLLPAEVANEIWTKAIPESIFMKYVPRTPLGGNGKTFPIITSDPEPQWVTETGVKAKGNHGVGSKTMTPYTMALILPFSNQFKRDMNGLYAEMISRVPAALGKKFDKTCAGFSAAPGSGFDTLAGAATVDIATSPSAGLLSAETAIEDAGYIYDHIILAPKGNSTFRGELDTSKRPLYTVSNGTVQLDVDTAKNLNIYDAGAAAVGEGKATPQTVGLVGDFTQARYGIVEDISMSITDQASITIDDEVINLWERNMFAVRFEFEVGFIVRDNAAFKKLTIPYVA